MAQACRPSRGHHACPGARVTQVMGLLPLAPEIQEHILSMPEVVRRPAITERARRPITQLEDHMEQRGVFSQLLDLKLVF